MGNCCGKSSTDEGDDNFQGQGRTLGGGGSAAAPPTNSNNAATRASIPASVGAGGKSIGGGGGGGASSDPRAAAAKAAEDRLKSSSQGRGKLGRQLDSQRAQTQTETLAQTARDNVAARDADAQARARNYE